MKKLLAMLLVLTMAFSLVACGSNTQATTSDETPTTADTETTAGSTEDTDSTVESLTIAITKDENTLSPFTYVSGTGLVVNRLIYDTLFTTDLDNNIIPWMVEDDYTIVDSKEYTFTLKEGLKFHNGNPVTAEDVKFSFEYPATQNVSGQRKVCNEIESIEIIDERTIKFTDPTVI